MAQYWTGWRILQRTVLYLGTILDRLKNTTTNSVISWHNTGQAEEHYNEQCNIMAQYWTGWRTLQRTSAKESRLSGWYLNAGCPERKASELSTEQRRSVTGSNWHGHS
jgi:hypothetical protein